MQAEELRRKLFRNYSKRTVTKVSDLKQTLVFFILNFDMDDRPLVRNGRQVSRVLAVSTRKKRLLQGFEMVNPNLSSD